MAAHHDDMPSMSSAGGLGGVAPPADNRAPEAPGPASLRRTPAADSTTSGSVRPGIGPYGCHTCRRSARRISSNRTGGLTASAPVSSPRRAASRALALRADADGDLHRAAFEAELLAQPPFHEPAVGGLEEAGREQHEVRRAYPGLGGEQDLR